MGRIFLSHASADASSAEQFLSALEKRGLECWIAPRDIPIGSSYPDEVAIAVADCRFFVVLFSKNTNKSQHVIRETELAVENDKPIIVVRLEEAKMDPGLRYLSGVGQRVDAFAYREGVGSAAFVESIAAKIRDSPNATSGRLISIDSHYPALAPSFKAEVFPPTGQSFVVELRRTRLVIGRGADCDIPIEDTLISRSHCSLEWDQQSQLFAVRDFGSTNVTLLNGSPVTDLCRINHGDSLRIGNTHLVFERVE